MTHAKRDDSFTLPQLGRRPQIRSGARWNSLLLIAGIFVILAALAGCGPSTADRETVDYAPLAADDWMVSTPAEQGLDPRLVAEAYRNVAGLETVTSTTPRAMEGS